MNEETLVELRKIREAILHIGPLDSEVTKEEQKRAREGIYKWTLALGVIDMVFLQSGAKSHSASLKKAIKKDEGLSQHTEKVLKDMCKYLNKIGKQAKKAAKPRHNADITFWKAFDESSKLWEDCLIETLSDELGITKEQVVEKHLKTSYD